MADGVNLIVIKGSQGYDVTDLVQQVKWSGRKGSSSRYIEVSMLDDEDRTDRANIDVEKGHQSEVLLCVCNRPGGSNSHLRLMTTVSTSQTTKIHSITATKH